MKKEINTNKPKWKNIGGTHRHFDGQVVKKGQVLFSDQKDISDGFKDKFVLVEGTIKEEQEEVNEEEACELVPVHKGRGKYIVVNAAIEGKPQINDGYLSKEDAYILAGLDLSEQKATNKEEVNEEDETDADSEDME